MSRDKNCLHGGGSAEHLCWAVWGFLPLIHRAPLADAMIGRLSQESTRILYTNMKTISGMSEGALIVDAPCEGSRLPRPLARARREVHSYRSLPEDAAASTTSRGATIAPPDRDGKGPHVDSLWGMQRLISSSLSTACIWSRARSGHSPEIARCPRAGGTVIGTTFPPMAAAAPARSFKAGNYREHALPGLDPSESMIIGAGFGRPGTLCRSSRP
jgi:hypothetical protein